LSILQGYWTSSNGLVSERPINVLMHKFKGSFLFFVHLFLEFEKKTTDQIQKLATEKKQNLISTVAVRKTTNL
jgi:hypothetical protein